ncbi:hypothetical protein FRB93_012286 [Tulasnella sp. JGI-2019a]|nr:hypothetical protein FRB93_012286 [Tulasnella sp. JGI-2019a]
MAPSMDISTLDQDHLALRTALENLGEYRIEYGQLNIDMDSVLGRGGFGVLRRAHFGEEEVAVKILRSDESKDVRVAKRLVREMKIWSGLRHQNVLRLLGFHLSQKLDLAIIALDALNGLIYLHGLNPPVIHGDIKAVNALVNREQREATYGRGQVFSWRS